MTITRHYLTVDGPEGKRGVHYRKCGNGPPLLMVHQSPRSSAEYAPLMQQWGQYFTCIAPDSPGFGQSDPLPMLEPDINDFADGVIDFARALGLEKTAAYGFHSGGIILVTALKRHPEFFSGLAVGGYAIWTPDEMRVFGASYLPPFVPSAYGEHLVWMWNRILEQSWFFPWFDVRGETRLSMAHDDPARVQAIATEMLDAGNAYRLGYGAVLKTPRDIPPVDAMTPPVLISAYDGDPLQAHIDRLGEMPAGWAAAKVATQAEHEALSLDFLRKYPAPVADSLAEDADRGWVALRTDGFNGLIHWRGKTDAKTIAMHAPGSEADLVEANDAIAFDLPGHGLSDRWPGDAPTDWSAWQAVLDAAADHFGTTHFSHTPIPAGDPVKLFPDLTPDRHGNHLVTAWSIVRAAHFFVPWYEANAANAIAFDPADIAPEKLMLEHRALIRATAARAMTIALQTGAI